MKAYAWPGNVREMENLIERLAIISGDGIIDDKNLASYLGLTESSDRVESREHLAQSGSLADAEKMLLKATLEKHKGIQSRAACQLGITVRQIGYKIKKFGLEDFVRQVRADHLPSSRVFPFRQFLPHRKNTPWIVAVFPEHGIIQKIASAHPLIPIRVQDSKNRGGPSCKKVLPEPLPKNF